LGFGCVIDDNNCSFKDAEVLCTNCMSQGSRLQQLNYKDGTGALQLQTRSSPTGLSNGTGLITNLLLTPTGQVVVGVETENDIDLSNDDQLVVKNNFRLVPLSGDLPACNYVRRGSLAVKEELADCDDSNTIKCKIDALYLCAKEQNFEWRKVLLH